jgi:hypothetical protein
MNKILVLILVMAMAPAAALADDEKNNSPMSDRMERMQKNLGLSDEQVAQIRQIRDNGGSKEEILAVLSDEQRELMKKRRAEMKGEGRKGSG